MMLHKIFHMNQSVEEAKRRLSSVNSYRHHLDGVERADFTSEGTSRWSLQLPFGFKADFVLSEAMSDDNTVVFKSLDGDLEICGMITYSKIKNNLTEIDITLNYESGSMFFNVLDRVFKIGDHFLVEQLRRARAHFEGIAAPAPRALDYFTHSHNLNTANA